MLVEAHDDYVRTVSSTYDDVLREVSDRIAASGSIGKLDIGALVVWKRLRADTPWASALMAKSERDVRSVTAVAVSAVRDHELSTAEAAGQGRDALLKLPGFGSG